MNNEKVENTQTTTEETKVGVGSANDTSGANVEVSTEKTVEKSTETSSDDSQSSGTEEKDAAPESNVNVKVENNFPANTTQTAHDPHKNYEAGQPIVDPVI
jgi:hypothetical protein